MSEWTPGEPLHDRGLWTRPIFELMDESRTVAPSSDAARWPEPFPWSELS